MQRDIHFDWIDVINSAFLFYALGSIAIVVEMNLIVGVQTIWTDVLHHNPNRTWIETLITIPVLGFAGGIFYGIFHLSGALLLASLVVLLSIRRAQSVSIWAIIAVVPVCVVVVYLQDAALPTFHWYTDEDTGPREATVSRALYFSSILVPALIAAWFGIQRHLPRERR
jgi:uncharacterized membrane protein YfcA